MNTRSYALRLAQELDAFPTAPHHKQAAAELRRLHAENESLAAALASSCDEQRHELWESGGIAGCERARVAERQRDALLEALKGMLHRDERNTCRHEETHRGGAIWEICDSCGAMWADDEGGKPEWEDPKELTQARAAIKTVEEGK